VVRHTPPNEAKEVFFFFFSSPLFSSFPSPPRIDRASSREFIELQKSTAGGLVSSTYKKISFFFFPFPPPPWAPHAWKIAAWTHCAFFFFPFLLLSPPLQDLFVIEATRNRVLVPLANPNRTHRRCKDPCAILFFPPFFFSFLPLPFLFRRRLYLDSFIRATRARISSKTRERRKIAVDVSSLSATSRLGVMKKIVLNTGALR